MESAEQVYATQIGFSDGGRLRVSLLAYLEVMELCMLNRNNLVAAHDCYMQLELGRKHDCCFHVCIRRIEWNSDKRCV